MVEWCGMEKEKGLVTRLKTVRNITLRILREKLHKFKYQLSLGFLFCWDRQSCPGPLVLSIKAVNYKTAPLIRSFMITESLF